MRQSAGRVFHHAAKPTLLASLALTPTFAAQQPVTPGPAAHPSAVTSKPAMDADGTYHAGNGVTVPKLVYTVDAEFSDAARRKKFAGTTVIGLKVGTDGLPRDVHVTRSAAEGVQPKLRKAALTQDEKALEAVRQYRFEPSTYEGRPVPVVISIEVNFHISPSK
jgi:TonB family protein